MQKIKKAHQTQSHYLEYLIFAFFALKSNFILPKQISQLFLLLIFIQPLFLAINFEKLGINNSEYYIQFLGLILRPAYFVLEKFNTNHEFDFILSLCFSLLQKLFLTLFIIKVFKNQSKAFEGFIPSFKNSLIWNMIYQLLNLFLILNGSYIFVDSLYLSFMSLKINLANELRYELLIFNILTIILIIFDCILSLVISETQITHIMSGIEKQKNSTLDFIYKILIMAQILLAICFVGNTAKYFFNIFGLIQQIITLLGIFSYTTYILSYQTTVILISVAINTTFHSIMLFQQAQDENFKTLFLVIFCLLSTILQKKHTQFDKSSLLVMFKISNVNEKEFLASLIRLINKDFCSSSDIVMLTTLVGKLHSSMICVDKNCCYCNQDCVLQTEQSCGITIAIYNKFIQNQVEKLIFHEQLHNLKNQKYFFQNNVLHYAYFLFDIGQFLKSLKFLNSLLLNNEKYQRSSKINILTQNELCLINLMNAYNFQEQVSWIDKIKIKYIIQKGKSQVIAKFYQSSLLAAQQSMIQDFIFNYLKNEKEVHLYEQKLVQVIQFKKLFFINLLSSRDNKYNNNQKSVSNNDDWFKLCSFIEQFQKLLKKSIQNQSQNNIRFFYIYAYFLGEILGDYYKAIHFFKTSKFRQLEALKFQKIKNFDLNQKVEYIIMGLCEDFANLQIITHSEQFFESYGYRTGNHNEFSKLIPEFLQKVHFHHVNQFLQNGKDKYYNVFQINLITTPCNLLTTVNMCHTINSLTTQNNLSFAVFIQDALIDYIFLLIDDQSKQCYFTKNLLSLVGWSQSEIKQLQEKNYLQNLTISYIYPDFEKQIDINSNSDEFRVIQAKFYFPRPTNNIQHLEQKLSQKPNPFVPQEVITLECDVFIIKKQVATQKFFQVEIQNITTKLLDLYGNSNTSLNKNTEYDEFEFNLKYSQSDEVSEILWNQDLKQTIISASKMKFIPNAQNFELERICKDAGDKGTFSLPEQYSNLNSRRDQTILQNDAQLTQKMIRLQSELHFALNDNQMKSVEEKNEQLEKINIIAQSNVLSNSAIVRDRMKQRHDLIGQIISLNAFKFEIKLISILTFWFILFCIFVILQYNILVNDLRACLISIQLTSFYSGIMSPHDLFFTMRNTITAYQQMNREGFVPSKDLQNLIQPFQEQIYIGFEEFRDCFYAQINNEILGFFINELNQTIYFMKENQTLIYPVELSVRDALYAILQYQHSQTMTLHYRKSTTNQPFQIFLFANYFKNHNKFEAIANDMYQYSLTFHLNLLMKWYSIWISFVLGLLICYGYLQYFQLVYFKQLDGFYKIIQYLTNSEIEKEIKKLSNSNILLTQSIKSIQKYNPESQLLKGEIHKSSSQISQSRFLQIAQGVSYFKNSQIRLKNVALFLFLLCLLFIFTCISVTQIINFYTKSRKTTQFYQEMLNMQLRPGNLYLYREIFLRWSNFTFLTENDRNSLYRMVNLAQQSIDNYITLANNVDFSQYLIKNNFIELFDKINTDSFCFMIDEEISKLIQQILQPIFQWCNK